MNTISYKSLREFYDGPKMNVVVDEFSQWDAGFDGILPIVSKKGTFDFPYDPTKSFSGILPTINEKLKQGWVPPDPRPKTMEDAIKAFNFAGYDFKIHKAPVSEPRFLRKNSWCMCVPEFTEDRDGNKITVNVITSGTWQKDENGKSIMVQDK